MTFDSEFSLAVVFLCFEDLLEKCFCDFSSINFSNFKVKKHGIFGHKRSKSDAEADDFLCPMDFGNGRMVNGKMDPEVNTLW